MPYHFVSDCLRVREPKPEVLPESDCTGHWQLQDDSGVGFFPDLSPADAADIGLAIALCWIIGFCWREIRRAITRIDS